MTRLDRVRDWSQRSAARYTYKACRNCGLVLLSPRPAASAIERYYPADYPPHLRQGESSAKRRFVRALLERLVDARFPRPTVSVVTLGRRPRILDIGCGSGGYLKRRASQGWEVWGVESDPDAANLAQQEVGVPAIHVGTLDAAAPCLPRNYCDLVALHDVLEHLHNPLAALRLARDLVTLDGLVEVLTPDVDSLESRAFRSNWFSVEAPRHIQLFSKATLQVTFGRAGLRVVAMRPTTIPTFALVSLENVLSERLRRRVYFNPLIRAGVFAALAPLTLSAAMLSGSGSSLWVWGRKLQAPVSTSAPVLRLRR